MPNPSGRRPRKLLPVALSDDGLGILLAPGLEAPPSHEVRIDLQLVKLLETARERLGRDHDGESALSPREIQGLLRRGVDVAEVARRARMPRPWIERFASPIEWERAGMATRARRAFFTRPRLGASALPLGEAVRSHLLGMDDDSFEAAWDAVRSGDTEDATWIVSCRLPSRGGRRILRWEYSPRRDELRALDEVSARYAWAPPKPADPSASERRPRSGKGQPGRAR